MGKKFDINYVKDYVENNSKCILISKEYYNSKTKLSLICECGEHFVTDFNTMRSRGKLYCRKCGIKIRASKRKKGFKHFYKVIKESSDCLLDKIITQENGKLSFVLTCRCGETFESSYSSFLNGKKRCRSCIEQERKAELEKNIKIYITSNNLNLLKVDKNMLSLKCNDCENVYNINYSDLKNRKYKVCNKCYKGKYIFNIKNSYSNILEVVKREGLSLITTRDEYLYTYGTKILVKCSCGENLKEMTFKNFNDLKYKMCGKCKDKYVAKNPYYNTATKFEHNFEEIFYQHMGDEYELLKHNDTKTSSKIKVRHSTCGTVYYPTLSKIIHESQRCPTCKKSKGETRIVKYLSSNNIRFETQYKIKACRDKRELPFDIYLPDYNLLIEYQGEFHYKIIFSLEGYLKQKKHDLIKKRYCRKNNINLLEINFWESHQISNILKYYLMKI